MTETPSKISFSIYRRGELVDEAEIVKPIVNIGKLSTSTLRLDDVSVSRKHAVIERRESGGWRITDLGSTNGTQVNDKTVVQATLSDGDKIKLGECILIVHLGDIPARADGEVPRAPKKATVQAPPIRGLGQDTFYDQRSDRDADGPMGLEVALLWGETVLSIEHFPRPLIITVGETQGCRFALPSEALGVPSFPLIVPQGPKFALNLQNEAITGDILVDGKVIGLDDMRSGGDATQFFTIDGNMRARLRAGEFTILVSHGPLSRGPRAGVVASWEMAPLVFFLISFILHSAFMVTLNMLPEEELKSHLDPTSKRAQIVKAMKMSKEKKKEKKEEKKEEKDEKKKKAKEKKEGKALDKIVKQIKPVEVRNPFRRLNEKQKKKKIQDLVDQTETGKQLANLTDILQQPNEGMRNMVVGITDASADPGDQVDPFGGEPYSGSDLVGTESIGYDMLRGYGGGMITGLGKKTTGPGVGNVNLDRKIQPKVTGGLAQVSGRLDRETVRKVIRRKLSGIRRCYQDSLQRDKGLKGRLTLAFRITPNGTVTGITVTGMESDVALTACVKRRIAVWRFPAPKSSGVIKVKYPVFLKTQSSQ